jgi:oligoribonuclease NrnB/cAMP/cGMP phosphodiesterase (DHH superfamily)
MKNKLSPYKSLVMTHADFDGIASLINVYNIVEAPEKNFQYYAADYHTIDKILQKIQKDTFDLLWILDLNLTKAQVDMLGQLTSYKKIIWIDHHHYEYDVKQYIKDKQILDCVFIHDETISACLATNNFIEYNWPNAHETCKEFCKLGDIYDMWRTDNSRFNEAYAINDLYWEYKYEKFFNIFKDGYKLLPEDKALMLSIHNERKAYEEDTINNYSQFNEEFGIVYVLNPACKHVNHITLTIPNNFFVILKYITETSIGYSIRIYDPNFDLTLQDVFAIIKKSGTNVINSGGHSKVGGIQVALEDNQKFLETINTIFERKLK